MGDKVAILGTVPNSRIVAPYEDQTWDIWCCSAGNSQGAAPPRLTEWFELHSLVDMRAEENKNWVPNYYTWLRTLTIPIWMQERNDDVPSGQPFPYRPLMDRFGPNKAKGLSNWFTSSIAWMFAFAIQRGYKTIGVFGVDMAAAEEHYTGQKAGLLRWFEIGRQLGIKVIVPLESTLAFDYPLYGYAEASRLGRALLIREIELRQRVVQLTQGIEAQMRDLHYLRGSLDQVVFDRRTYPTNDMAPEIDDIDAHLSQETRDALAKPVSEQLLVPASELRGPPSAEDFSNSPEAAALLPKSKANGQIPVES